MDNKKTKLSLSGIAKKSIENIELAKTQSKNSVVIKKKSSKFTNKGNFNRTTSVRSKSPSSPSGSFTPRSTLAPKTSSPITNDYEKRKLAEQRATRRLKGERIKIQGYLEDFALSKAEADELIMSARNIIYKD